MNQIHSYGQYNITTTIKEGLHSTRKYPLGYYVDVGRSRYRYGLIAVDSAQEGKLYGQPKNSGFSANSGYLVSACMPTKGGASGDRRFLLYSASFVSMPEEFIGGFVAFISTAGSPFVYQIKDIESGLSTTTSVTLTEPLYSALTSATSLAYFYDNPWYNLTMCSGGSAADASAAEPRGFAHAVNSANSGYCFFKTRGPLTAVLQSAATSMGVDLVPTLSGELRPVSTTDDITPCQVVARAMMAGAAADMITVNALLE